MSKPKPIQIIIPNPCSQNWDEMTPDGNGRHCDHCQKTVIDFTTWSDTALYNFLSKNNDHVCGRFFSTQVDRTINIPYQPHSQLYRIAVALGLTLLFTQTPHLLAQGRPPKIIQSDSIRQINAICEHAGELHGRVVDDKKEPLPSAVIQVYQNGILKGGNVSDYDGNYIIKPLDTGNYDILVLYAGYDSLEHTGITISSSMITQQNFQLNHKPGTKLQGEMVLIMGYAPRLPDKDNPTKRTFSRQEINHMPH